MSDNTIKTVSIVPNTNNLFNAFAKDFELNAKLIKPMTLEVHEAVHSILSTLNVAFHAITTTEQLEDLQTRLAQVVSTSNDDLFTKREARDEEEYCSLHQDSSANCSCND